MGNPKQKWTSEEEEALRAGVKKHGTGKWKNIQRDPEFTHLLHSRSNIDLKDKWRNLTVSASNGTVPRDKSKALKLKVIPDAPAAHLPTSSLAAPPTPSIPISHDVSLDPVADDLSNGKQASKYNELIYEALSTLKGPNGSDSTAIFNFIEQRLEAPPPPNLRRIVTNRLRRLCGQEKLEKVGNSYRIRTKKEVQKEKVPPLPPPKEKIQPRQEKHTGYLGDTLEVATFTTASWIADAENKSSIAAEAVKESERIMKMTEETDAFLLLATEFLEKSSFSDIVILA